MEVRDWLLKVHLKTIHGANLPACEYSRDQSCCIVQPHTPLMKCTTIKNGPFFDDNIKGIKNLHEVTFEQHLQNDGLH